MYQIMDKKIQKKDEESSLKCSKLLKKYVWSLQNTKLTYTTVKSTFSFSFFGVRQTEN